MLTMLPSIDNDRRALAYESCNPAHISSIFLSSIGDISLFMILDLVLVLVLISIADLDDVNSKL